MCRQSVWAGLALFCAIAAKGLAAEPNGRWIRAERASPNSEEAEASVDEPEDAWPTFDEVRDCVEQLFAAKPDYVAGDLVTREDANAVFRELESLGWAVATQDVVISAMIPANHLMVSQFRSVAGKKFMRKISSLPLGYDRIDRLIRLPRGEQMFRDLVKGPGGDKLIEYMTSSKGGENLGRQLSATPKGADFNKPTGRLYTAAQLLNRLHAEYDLAEQRRSAGNAGASQRP